MQQASTTELPVDTEMGSGNPDKSTSSSGITSLSEILATLRVAPGKQRVSRRRGKTAVLTSSPYKNQQLEADKKMKKIKNMSNLVPKLRDVQQTIIHCQSRRVNMPFKFHQHLKVIAVTLHLKIP